MDNCGEGDRGWVEWDEEELAEVLRATCANPPRRFALCEDTDEMRVLAWGMDFGDGAMLTGPGLLAGSFQSAHTALRRFGINRDVHLYWIDHETGPSDPAALTDSEPTR